MKKYLLFIISMLCVSIGAWGGISITYDGNTPIINITYDGNTPIINIENDPDLSSLSLDTKDEWDNSYWAKLGAYGVSKMVVKGSISEVGLQKIQSVLASYTSEFNGNNAEEKSRYLDLTQATFSGTVTSLQITDARIPSALLPAGTDVSGINFGSNIKYAYAASKDDGKANLYVSSSQTDIPSQVTSDIETIKANGINVCGEGAEGIKTKLITAGVDEEKISIPFSPTQKVTGGSIQVQLEEYLTQYPGKVAADFKSLTVTGTLTSGDVTYLSNLTGLTTLDLTGAIFGTGVTKASIAAAVPSTTTVLYPASYTISDDCKVTIDMGKAMGDDLATILAHVKAALGSTSICTLIVTGPVSNNDLIALGGTNMTGATRIDLSGATLGSGVTIDNIKLPATLEQLVLPKDQMFSVALKSKLTAATNLNYAYTPSSDGTATGPNQADENNPSTYSYDPTKNTIADYVWVNKAGGLAQALENEEQLRNSFYIKVASEVPLTTTDVNFNALSNKPTNYLFLDFSESNLTPAVANSYTVTDNIAYRIILPDNWSNADLAHFQNNGNKGNLAAVYSYEGSKLNILVITDDSYSGTALQNRRIVRAGTNAIDILPGAYTNNHQFGTATTEGKGIINAINSADPDIKSVYISIANTGNNASVTYTIANSNITYLSFEGIKSAYNHGPIVNVTGCSSLQTLNLKDAVLNGVVANGITSLTTVDMTGTTNSGTTNLSDTGLKTFTTNSSTDFQAALNLTSTAITSFATQAKVTGDINLNACSSLAHIDVSGTQFQNTTSMIHVDESSTENSANTDAIDALTTIQVPTGFSSSSRIHPYNEVKDKIVEAATTGEFALDDGCKIDYDATTGIATVTALHPGCLKQLMEKNNNYSKFPAGTIFTFNVGTTEAPVDCKLNAADLAALAGDATNKNYNKFYVDLYNLPASYTDGDNTYYYDDAKSGTTTTNGIISEAINTLRTNNWQYKGLLLPKTAKDIGTTLIQDRTEDATKLATCSQFVAYSGAIGTGESSKVLTASYIYKAADDWGVSYEQRLLNMKGVMDLHEDIKNNTTYYSVSTNCETPFDLSEIPTETTGGAKTSKLETINNNMVTGAGKPSIYAYPAEVGVMKDVVDNTGIKSTPDLETLKVTGPVDADDIASINKFTDGPRVFDLSEATGEITKAMLESITNANIEYIILPAGMTKDVVCEAKYKDALKNGKLKAVISSTNTNLVAYVNTPGSLAEARYLATGGTVDANTGLITPTQTGMQSVTLAGNLNAADIAANTAGKKVDEDGHWGNGSGNVSSIALSSEQGTVTKIDLEDAVFPNYTDMNFSYAGLASISDITLPTSTQMNKIPAECFMGITSFNEIFIPYNYEYIENAAFYLAEVSHITTADANGGLIDNGENTFTFSKNLKEIGQEPNPLLTDGKPTPLANPVFFSGAIHNLTDVYVLRTGYEDETFSPTKCYRGAFGAGPTYGWGGFDGGNIYCREKYKNGTQLFTILNYPDKASISNDTDGSKYTAMSEAYTDPTKVYTKKDQTGALDANGELIPWPTHMELGRSYNQAIRGVTWDAWDHTDKEGYMTSQGNPPGGVVNFNVTEFPAGVTEQDNTKTYPAEYTGWHEFVLSKATYVAPDETVKKDIVYREYEQDGWYTFCIPFDMTRQQVIELMGVPASTDGVKTTTGTFTFDTEGNMTGGTVNDTDILPDIRTLRRVERTEGSTGIVNLQLSDNLNDGRYLKIDLENETNSKYENNDGDIVIRGGYPYIIKPYKQKGDAFTNLGRTILARYSFPMSQSVVMTARPDTYIEIGGEKTGEKSKFAKPFTNHKIQAFLTNEENRGYTTYNDGEGDQKYYYTFIGQFWRQPLPLYSYYMVTHKWYYYKNYQANYYWNPYKCIITVATKQLSKGEKETDWADTWKVVIPEEAAKDSKGHAVFNESLYLTYSNGRDDSFTTSSAPKMFYFSLGGDTMDTINGNETTIIEKLDGVDAVPESMKVYSLSGQYMGVTLNGLAKGIYIVNGKKVVVK